MAASISLAYASQLTVTQYLADQGTASEANSKVTHSSLNKNANYNSGTTPPVSAYGGQSAYALSAGALTIDLRALLGTNGASVDGNGLKVQFFRFKNNGANVMTISPGASNGYALFGAGNDFEAQPGMEVLVKWNDNLGDIGGSAKTIDIAGTGSQTFEAEFVMG